MARSKITNEEQALAAVRQNGWTLQKVPYNLRTPELCFEAVKEDGDAIELVPENLKTAELCLEAINSVFARVFKNVPEALRDEVRAAFKSGE